MKKSDVLNAFKEWLKIKKEELDHDEALFGKECISEVGKVYFSDYMKAKENLLYETSSPLEFIQALESFYDAYVAYLKTIAFVSSEDIVGFIEDRCTFINELRDLFLRIALYGIKWEDE
ncbi:MAG: hypothetical protein K2H85_06530 [Allobaculum sp.]|nr:hypothetical protein [Allobaculum sp.]